MHRCTRLTCLATLLTLCIPLSTTAAPPETLSLDGTWEIAFDPDNIGREAKWHEPEVFGGLEIRRSIPVPSCWELTEKDYEGVAFYQRKFSIPAHWKGRAVRLHFGAVNFLAEVWLNGHAIGTHEGGFTPFEFRVEDLLKFDGENTLTLRVVGPILLQDKQVDGMGRMETTQWRGAITGGIWQPVKLIASGEVYVRNVFIEPKLADGTVTFHGDFMHAGERVESCEFETVIWSTNIPSGVAERVKTPIDMEPGLNHLRWTLEIPDVIPWSPDSPHLYRVEINVTNADGRSDQWTTRFGMREFTIRDQKFYLNGKPFYLKATFFEGLYPTKLAYPDSREMAIREIRLAKEAGFNMIRPWRKPPPPMWLDLADEMGVLTVGSLAVECMDFPLESAHLPRWVENEVRESILRDRNRTCVVQWELFNELKRPVLMRLLHPMAMLARELDPTRLILDESGGWAQGANMFLPYRSEPLKFNDIHDYPGPYINDEVYNKLILTGTKTHAEMRQMGLKGRLPGKNVIPGLMSFFSELGYGSLPDLVANNRQFAQEGNPLAPPTVYHKRLAEDYRRAFKESGFDQIYPDFQDFCRQEQRLHGTANKRMIEAVRCNPRVEGYCVHALTAGDWIMGAALIDLWRNPKGYVYEGTKAANQPRIVSIRIRPRNAYAAQGTQVEITGVNEQAEMKGSLKVSVTDERGKRVFSQHTPFDLPTGITPLYSEELVTQGLRGSYTVTAEIFADDGTLITRNQEGLDVFAADQLTPPRKRIAVYDPWNRLKPFLKKSGIPFEAFSPSTSPTLPLFVTRSNPKPPAKWKDFVDLKAFAEAGGTAVYLGGGGERYGWGKPVPTPAFLPVKAGSKLARATWQPITHLVHDHPVFSGLPVNSILGSIYENVWAELTLVGLEGEIIAGSIGFDWYPGLDKRLRHYNGPGDVWYGSDLASVPVGNGRCIMSQLRLVDNLGKDPVADKLLFNLIEWVAVQ